LLTKTRKLLLLETPIRDKENHGTKPRTLAEVTPELRQIFHRLADGELKWPLYLWGPPGSGKSCAALCLIDHIKGGKFWHMSAFDSLVQRIKKGIEERPYPETGKIPEAGWWRWFAYLPSVALDDVGSQEVSSETQEDTLFLALEARDGGQPLVTTSNRSPKEIETAYSQRIHSRMCSGTIHRLEGRDRRFDS
jgi:DNA replication protein DnaC